MGNKNVFWNSKFAIWGCARGDYGIITLKNSLCPRPFWWWQWKLQWQFHLRQNITAWVCDFSTFLHKWYFLNSPWVAFCLASYSFSCKYHQERDCRGGYDGNRKIGGCLKTYVLVSLKRKKSHFHPHGERKTVVVWILTRPPKAEPK